MPAQAGTLETIARELGIALAVLQQRASAEGPANFIADLGLRPPPALVAEVQLINAVTAVATAAAGLPTPVSNLIGALEGDDTGQILSAGEQVIGAIAQVVSAISALSSALQAVAGSAAGLTPAQVTQIGTFAQQLPRRLFDYTVIEYLAMKGPTIVPTLAVTGFVEDVELPGDPTDPMSPPLRSRVIHYEDLGQLLTNPEQYLTNVFQWGSASFDGTALFTLLKAFLDAFQVPCEILTPPGQPPIFEAFLLRMTADTSAAPPGLTLTLRFPAIQSFTQTYQLSDSWALNVNVSATFVEGIQGTILPPAHLSLAPPSGSVALQATAGLVAQNADGTPLVLLGQTGGSVLQTQSVEADFGFNATWSSATGRATGEPTIGLKIAGGKLVIDMSEADGFLADLLGGATVQSTFDLAATWEPDVGLHVTGGAQLEIDLPLHLDLGPVEIETLYLVGGVNSDGLDLELSAALGATLGPIQASVDRVGVEAALSFPSGGGGNLGPADLQISFKPPDGVGIALDLGLASGGGYISFDPSKGQYAGVLQVSLVDVIQVVVIGVIETIMPDGSTGFSFLLIITFNFPPIQLGFGFTLNGVGGLGGINRSMSVSALQAGFRAHTLDSVLSPPDPIANAPQIISDITNFFPVAPGRYVFGPMLTVGWGTPSLITLTLGVLLEVPDPITIVILGLIDAGLPTQDEALLELHIEVLGVIDFGAQTLSIDGSLYDSSLLVFSLAGDLAFRLAWGSNQNFVFSLGGFNPHFNTDGLDVPANMQRMSVSIGDGDNPRISSNSYFAITSNSVQFGANVQAYASAGGFSVQGYLGFDVLFILSPFSFEFDFTASFDVAYDGDTLAGLSVSGSISGPTPWHFHGDASIHFLFFSVSASVNLTWGSSTQATIPQKPVLPDLFAALGNPASWTAALPSGTGPTVTLTTPAPGGQLLLVHPMGTLTVKETVVPLDLPITRYGNAAPSDGTEFSISAVAIGAQSEAIQTITDYFAPGQFLTLSDADKLSQPSFESYDAGVEIGSTAVVNGQTCTRTVTYDEYYIDTPTGFSRFSRGYLLPANIQSSLTNWGAGFTSLAKHTGLAKYDADVAGPGVEVQDAVYVVASTVDLSVRSDIASSGGSTFYQTQAALNAYLALHPEETAGLQVLPLHEIAA